MLGFLAFLLAGMHITLAWRRWCRCSVKWSWSSRCSSWMQTWTPRTISQRYFPWVLLHLTLCAFFCCVWESVWMPQVLSGWEVSSLQHEATWTPCSWASLSSIEVKVNWNYCTCLTELRWDCRSSTSAPAVVSVCSVWWSKCITCEGERRGAVRDVSAFQEASSSLSKALSLGQQGVLLSPWDPFQDLTCLQAVIAANCFPAKCKDTILLSLSEDTEFCCVSKETGVV